MKRTRRKSLFNPISNDSSAGHVSNWDNDGVLVPTELTALDLCAPGACIRADATAVLGMITSEE